MMHVRGSKWLKYKQNCRRIEIRLIRVAGLRCSILLNQRSTISRVIGCPNLSSLIRKRSRYRRIFWLPASSLPAARRVSRNARSRNANGLRKRQVAIGSSFFGPGHHHFSKSFQIRLGIDESCIDVTMAKDVGDRFYRGVVSQGSNRPRMTQRCRPAAGRLTPGLFHVTSDNPRDSETTERPEWGLGSQEYFPEWSLRESMPKISNDGFSDCFHER